MVIKGVVSRWNAKRGFGFAVCDDGRPDIFIHATALPKGFRSLIEHDIIEFEIGEFNGRPVAENIKLISRRIPSARPEQVQGARN